MTDGDADGSCHVCELNAAGTSLPFRERLYLDDDWRVAHAWSALPGWLVVAPRRHVEGLAELTPAEAARLGELLRAVSAALVDVVRCRRTYVVLFAEQPRARAVGDRNRGVPREGMIVSVHGRPLTTAPREAVA